MSALNYTSGNIANLTAGGSANMADVQGPFVDVRVWANGNVDEVNVPNLSAAFTTYKHLYRGVALLANPGPAGTYLVSLANAAAGNILVNTPQASTSAHLMWLDPALYLANARTTKLNLRVTAVPNAVALAITYTVGLYPIATYGGGSGSGPIVATLGTVVAGSTAVVASPAAATATTGTGSDFNFPAVGAYALAAVTSGTAATNNITELIVTLEMRQA